MIRDWFRRKSEILYEIDFLRRERLDLIDALAKAQQVNVAAVRSDAARGDVKAGRE